MKRVLVTGATGFVGSVLCETLGEAGYRVRAALRSDRPVPAAIAEKTIVGDIGGATDWTAALDGVDCVVHTAARVHVMHDAATNAELYMESNVRGTAQLATASVRAGVERFVYLSSIKVNGEETPAGRCYTADDPPQPLDDYGVSKWRAEQSLREIAQGTALTFAIVRPPLVYGAGVRANFLRLMNWVHKGIPLPLGAVDNRRSLVSVWNLCSLVQHLLANERSRNRTWLVSDGEDLSTPALIRGIARAMGKPARLPAVPVGMLVAGGKLLGKESEVRRLCGSLAVDISATRSELGWSPPVSVEAALARTVDWYLRKESSRGA